MTARFKINMLILAILSMSLAACNHTPPPLPPAQAVQPAPEPILPSGTLSDSPMTAEVALEKNWTAQLSKGRKMVLASQQSARKYEGLTDLNLEFNYYLIQANGKSIEFDCNAVADKIIDRELVPEVVKTCPGIQKIAQKFWSHEPHDIQFSDLRGRTWKQVPKS